jgi:hypothetical protein
MEFVYAPVVHMAVRLREEFLRVPINLGPPAANTQGATPRKDQAQAANKGKSKKIDKGKGKMIKLEKPKKVVPIPLQTGGAFKIFEKAQTPPTSPAVLSAKKSLALEKKKVEVPPRVARV